MTMRIGYVVRNSGPEAIECVRTLPALAEQLGFSTVWMTDHVVGVRGFGDHYEPQWSEILTSLSYAAASTTTIRLGTGILVVPYRDPVLAAKMIATIDQLSGGRVVLGVGAGWSRAEFADLGMGHRFERRGAVLDESLDLMRACWSSEGEMSWDGEEFSLREMTFAPNPVHGTVPIWVGGNTAPAIRRAARIADAWHPTNIEPDELARLGESLDEQRGSTVARTIRLGISENELPAIGDLLHRYEQAGCVEAAVQVRLESSRADDHHRALEALASHILG